MNAARPPGAKTEALWRADAYLRTCTAVVTELSGESSAVLDRTVFYGGGGGQPCDTGRVAPHSGDGPVREVRAASYGEDGAILHHLESSEAELQVGDEVRAEIDWRRRYRHMRMHTLLHLLSVALPFPVTGGAIGSEKSRLDFDMPEAPDREALTARLEELVAADCPVSETWIEPAELAARPELVKTVGVRPPTGPGLVRLVRIGDAERPVDLQPCGGTHVRSTAEVGRLRLGKIEKKGRNNRRVNVHLEDGTDASVNPP